MGYVHQMVINDRCKVIKRCPARLCNDKIIESLGINLNVAPNEIMEIGFGTLWNSEPYYGPFTSGNPFSCLIEGNSAASVVVPVYLVCLLSRSTFLLYLFRGTKTIVSMAIFKESVQRILVCVKPFSLFIWAIISANIRTLVPCDPEPLEAIKNGLFGFRGGALGIGIVYPKDECSTIVSCKKIVEKACSCVANV
ncbi:MAG: hypothetical protein BWX90_00375 [bacterium ADurb.Bin132]|nr:MAG: hypothetical protein BWX90_00375 [bacterium ADurb.Bin132]